jgi:hypothetical protein
MADNVIINQIQWGSDLPKWATEATQEKIAEKLGAIEKINKETKENDKKNAAKDQKQNKDTTTILEKGFKSMKEAAKKNTEAFNKFSADKLIPKTPFKSFNNGLTKVAGRLGIFGAALGAVGFVIGGIVGRFKAFSDQFRTLFATGFRFEQGSMGLAKAAVRAEMSLDQYTEILGRYSTTVGVLGTRAFSDLNVAMRENLSEVGLLGMNLSELTEYTAEYLDQRRLLGILEESDRNALAQNTETYLKNISALSTLLNVSRDQISQIIKSSVTVAAFTNALNQAPEALREQMLQTAQVVTGGFAALGNDYANQLAGAFTTAIGRGGLFFTEAGRELLAISQPLYHAMSDLTNTVGPNEAGAKFSSMLDIMANTTDAERERLMILERSNTQYSEGARKMIGLINQAQQLEDEQIDAIKNMEKFREAQDVDRTTRAFTNFEIATQKLKVTFDKFFTSLFGNNKVLDLFERIMVRVSESFKKFADMILNNAGSIGDAIGDAFEAVIKFFEGFKGKTIGGVLMHALSPIFTGLKYVISSGIRMGFNLIAASLGSVGRAMLGADNPITPFAKDYQAMNSVLNDPTRATDNVSLAVGGAPIPVDMGSYKDLIQAQRDLIAEEQGRIDRSLKGVDEYWGRETKGREKSQKKIEAALAEIERLEEQRFEKQKKFDELKNKVENINKEKFLQTFGNDYDYEQSIKSGTLTLREGVDATGQTTQRGTMTDMMDGEKIASAKMRIMRQYLPMTGQGDPNQDPTKNYYERMIMELQNANQLLQKSINANKANTERIVS